MSVIISVLNDILLEWKKQHDILSGISSQFSDCEGFLWFDNFPLCKITEDLEVMRADFDSDGIEYVLTGNRCIDVSFIWPEDSGPKISSVSLSYQLFNEDVDI